MVSTAPLRRNPRDRVVAGVASGIAEHLRLPPLAVRLTFVALLAVNGVGALLYVAYWVVLPSAPAPRPARRGGLQALALLAIAAGVILAEIQGSGFGIGWTVVVLVCVVALGAGTIWHQAEAGEAGRRRFLVRVAGGGLLVVVGIIGLLGVFSPLSAAGGAGIFSSLLFALVALTGLVLALAPALWRMLAQLREERVARIRERERAEVAALVHDQVLHTLALIQRSATDAAGVVRLARAQERSLRTWLYRPAGSPTERFAAALEQVAAEIEDSFDVDVETVVVGDASHDDRVAALVGATREALVNAARHSGVRSVSVYAEAEPERLSVYIRDRGAGFDMSTVDEDRHGIRGSIVARMLRHGGRAEIRSTPGEGTEVELTMPVRAAGNHG